MMITSMVTEEWPATVFTWENGDASISYGNVFLSYFNVISVPAYGNGLFWDFDPKKSATSGSVNTNLRVVAANNVTQPTPCSSAGNAPSPQQYQAMGYVAQASWLFGPAVGGLSNAGALAMFKRGLPLDAQVLYGGTQAYANYSYGVFMSAAGYSLDFALWGANAYASSQSSYPQNTPMSPNYPSTPASNVTNITNGYNAQQSGTLCSTTGG